MSIEGCPCPARVVVTVVVQLTIGALLTAEAAGAPPRQPRPLTPWDQGAVDRARLGALRKLQEAECQKLLTDFEDAQGRPLLKTLEEWNLAPEAYASIVTFVDGSSQPRCRGRKTALAATPGSRRIYVCRSFADIQLREPRLAESMVIHEILHTLGLGEDPPTSLEITRRVEARCR